MIRESYKKVRKNKGAAGIDDETITKYEERLEDNLYILWNRISSGSYFPTPVLEVGIAKDDGRKRKLGIPTVNDRVAQQVIKATCNHGLKEHRKDKFKTVQFDFLGFSFQQ